MRLPVFHPFQQRLGDWTDCTLEVHCPTPGCKRGVSYPPVRMLADELGGGMLFSDLLNRWRCKLCGSKPGPVYLVVGHHRKHCGGPAPDWSLELVPEPQPHHPLYPPGS